MPDCSYCGRFINTSTTGWTCNRPDEKAATAERAAAPPPAPAPVPPAPLWTADEAAELSRFFKSRLTLDAYMHDLRVAATAVVHTDATQQYGKRLALMESAVRKAYTTNPKEPA